MRPNPPLILLRLLWDLLRIAGIIALVYLACRYGRAQIDSAVFMPASWWRR